MNIVNQILLSENKYEAFLIGGKEVSERAPQFINSLNNYFQKLGDSEKNQEMLKYLAIPKVENNVLNWTVDFKFEKSVRFDQASLELQDMACKKLEEFFSAAQKVARAGSIKSNNDDKTFSEFILGTTQDQVCAFCYPSEETIFILDDKIPVITFWGYHSKNDIKSLSLKPFTTLRERINVKIEQEKVRLEEEARAKEAKESAALFTGVTGSSDAAQVIDNNTSSNITSSSSNSQSTNTTNLNEHNTRSEDVKTAYNESNFSTNSQFNQTTNRIVTEHEDVYITRKESHHRCWIFTYPCIGFLVFLLLLLLFLILLWWWKPWLSWNPFGLLANNIPALSQLVDDKQNPINTLGDIAGLIEDQGIDGLGSGNANDAAGTGDKAAQQGDGTVKGDANLNLNDISGAAADGANKNELNSKSDSDSKSKSNLEVNRFVGDAGADGVAGAPDLAAIANDAGNDSKTNLDNKSKQDSESNSVINVHDGVGVPTGPMANSLNGANPVDPALGAAGADVAGAAGAANADGKAGTNASSNGEDIADLNAKAVAEARAAEAAASGEPVKGLPPVDPGFNPADANVALANNDELAAARAAEAQATGAKGAVAVKTPANALSFTPSQLKQQGTAVLQGNWATTSGLMDNTNGSPLNLGYRSGPNGNEVVVTRHDGSKCTVATSMSASGNSVTISPEGRAKCPDNTTYQIPNIKCSGSESGSVKCTGAYGNSTFPINFYKQQKSSFSY